MSEIVQPPLDSSPNNQELAKVSMDEAVTVTKAVASYGDTLILKSLSMKVNKGTVYALLGPSGCGKTTLLSCILGRKSLESGVISVYGGKPGDRQLGLPGPLVGFMPQDICLYQEFTIKETFQYFGRLQKMKSDSLEKKQLWLLEMLDLPEESRRVAKLSGGQKRRLSFAVALLHNPKLLILDEPTVGVDPLVR
jgi:ABC-type multidrug transport system ATPase subunit